MVLAKKIVQWSKRFEYKLDETNTLREVYSDDGQFGLRSCARLRDVEVAERLRELLARVEIPYLFEFQYALVSDIVSGPTRNHRSRDPSVSRLSLVTLSSAARLSDD